MQRSSRATGRELAMSAVVCLLAVSAAGLIPWFLWRYPESTMTFFCGLMLVRCVWSFVEWWLVRKDPEPAVAKWTRSPVFPIFDAIGACAFSFLLIRSWPVHNSRGIAGVLVGLCITSMQVYGMYLRRKGLRNEHAPDPIPPSGTT